MSADAAQAPVLPRARVVYARVLAVCCPVVLALMVLAFALYISGLLPPAVPLADLPGLWTRSAGAALDAVGVQPGWGWLAQWRCGDVLCLAALALLTLGTPIACSAAMVQYLRRREYTLGVIALLQTLVLLAAMSGLIAVHR
jgi:hypothetical protein